MAQVNRNTLMMVLPIAAAVLLMGVSCYYQGIWSERWGEFPELEVFSEQLTEVPINIGEWRGTDEAESNERVKRISGAEGEINRTYRNAAGETVRVMIMCARFQDVFNHTPEICYPAAGFEMQTKPEREVFEIHGEPVQFFTTTFLKSEPTGTHAERGYWSWTADGTWLAPSNERVTFAGTRALYKLYIFGAVPTSTTARSDHDYCSDFIRAFMPALQTALRPGFVRAERLRNGEEVAEADAAAETAEPAADAAAPAEPPAAVEEPAAKAAAPEAAS